MRNKLIIRFLEDRVIAERESCAQPNDMRILEKWMEANFILKAKYIPKLPILSASTSSQPAYQ